MFGIELPEWLNRRLAGLARAINRAAALLEAARKIFGTAIECTHCGHENPREFMRCVNCGEWIRTKA